MIIDNANDNQIIVNNDNDDFVDDVRLNNNQVFSTTKKKIGES